MPRYKLWLPSAGEWLHDDGGGRDVAADTAEEAKDYFEDWEGDRPEFVHSSIARGRILYKRDIDNGDGIDGSEPGDTAFDYATDDGRELKPGEVRVWSKGTPSWHWQMKPLPQESIHPRSIPAGCSIGLSEPTRSARTTETPREVDGIWLVEVELWPDYAEKLEVRVLDDDVHVLPTGDWPIVRYELTVEGEHVGNGPEDELRRLRDERTAKLDDEWKAKHAA